MNKFIPLALCGILLLGTFMFVGLETGNLILPKNKVLGFTIEKINLDSQIITLNPQDFLLKIVAPNKKLGVKI